MKIKEKVEINISKDDLTEIIKEHFKKKGYDIKQTYFRVTAEYDPDDWQDRYGPTYVFKEVECEAVKLNKSN